MEKLVAMSQIKDLCKSELKTKYGKSFYYIILWLIDWSFSKVKTASPVIINLCIDKKNSIMTFQ